MFMGSFFFSPPLVAKGIRHATVIFDRSTAVGARVDEAEYFFGTVWENIHDDGYLGKIKRCKASVQRPEQSRPDIQRIPKFLPATDGTILAPAKVFRCTAR